MWEGGRQGQKAELKPREASGPDSTEGKVEEGGGVRQDTCKDPQKTVFAASTLARTYTTASNTPYRTGNVRLSYKGQGLPTSLEFSSTTDNL